MCVCVCVQEKGKLRRKKKFPGHVYMFLVCVILRKLLDDRFRDLEFYYKKLLLCSANMYSMNRIMEIIHFSYFSLNHAKINRHFWLQLDLNDHFFLSATKSDLASVYVMCHHK